MKERIVIVEKELTNFLLKHKDNHEICAFSPAVIMTKSKVEQVPENWGDFLELCKTLKKVLIPANEYYVEFNKLRFYMDGMFYQ